MTDTLKKSILRNIRSLETPNRFYLSEGTVVVACPSINSYQVRPGYNILTGYTVTCTATSSSITYKEDDKVIFAAVTSSTLEDTGIDSRIGVILGKFQMLAMDVDASERNPGVNVFPVEGYSWKDYKIPNLFPESLQDRGQGKSLDSYGGDFTHMGELGNFLHCGYSSSSIGASPMARLIFNTLHDGGKLYTLLWQHNSMCSEEGFYPDQDSYVFYRRRGITAGESTGAYIPPASYTYDEELKIYKPVENQQAIFRNEELEGMLVDGEWSYGSLPEQKADSDVRLETTSSKPPLGLISDRRKYDGTMELRTARGFSVVKSLFVPVPRSLVPEDKLEEQAEVTSKEWFEENSDQVPYAAQLAALIESEMFAANTANYYQQRMRKRPKHWKIYSREELKSEYDTDIEQAQNSLDVLPDSDPYYTNDAEKQLYVTDPATGVKTRLNAAESMFKMLDDGSVVISDGYGSEIRMCRGNITITCPGDLQFLPGRDMSSMVPRRSFQVVGGDAFIHSSKGSVNVKAENNITIMSGNSGKGALLLENKATDDFSTSTWSDGIRTGQPINSGIVIKSKRGVAMLAQNMYVGLNAVDDRGSGGLERSTTGSIVIDACSGVLATFGKYIYSRSEAETVNASADKNSGTGSILSVRPAGMSLLGSKLDVGVGILALNKASGQISMNHITKAGVANKPVDVGSSEPMVRIKGSVSMVGTAKVQGPLQADSVSADTVSMQDLGIDHTHGGGKGPEGVTMSSLYSDVGKYTSTEFKTQLDRDKALYTGLGLYNMSFFYPTTESLQLSGKRIFMNRWQRMLVKQGPGEYWSEEPVLASDDTATYVYPGETGWNEDSFVGIEDDGRLSIKSLYGNYVINCKKLGGEYGG